MLFIMLENFGDSFNVPLNMTTFLCFDSLKISVFCPKNFYDSFYRYSGLGPFQLETVWVIYRQETLSEAVSPLNTMIIITFM